MLATCKAWKITPAEFRALPLEDQASMVGLDQVQARMASVEAQEQRQNEEIARRQNR